MHLKIETVPPYSKPFHMKQPLHIVGAGILLGLLACVPLRAWPHDIYLVPTAHVGDSGMREMKALASAYPASISDATKHDGDWAVKVNGEWFYWAHGRILPASQRGRWRHYIRRWDRAVYPVGSLPPIPRLDPQAEARLRKTIGEFGLHPPHMSQDFLKRLFGATSRNAIRSQLVTVNFLGFRVLVNRRIAKPLRRVAAECRSLSQTDPRIAAFFRNLAHIEGFRFRHVAGTAYCSYHCYGLAVDLIPRNYGKAIYWRWVWMSDKAGKWWATPYSQRWMVPPQVVSAFEKHGFVWGGKWMFFDDMHFEYRPEIIILTRDMNRVGRKH